MLLWITARAIELALALAAEVPPTPHLYEATSDRGVAVKEAFLRDALDFHRHRAELLRRFPQSFEEERSGSLNARSSFWIHVGVAAHPGLVLEKLEVSVDGIALEPDFGGGAPGDLNPDGLRWHSLRLPPNVSRGEHLLGVTMSFERRAGLASLLEKTPLSSAGASLRRQTAGFLPIFLDLSKREIFLHVRRPAGSGNKALVVSQIPAEAVL